MPWMTPLARLVPAALIAFAVFVGLGSAFAAGDVQDAESQAFVVPQPRLGDRAVYDISLAGGWAVPADALAGPFRALDLTWSRGEPMRVGDRLLHDVDLVDLAYHLPGVDPTYNMTTRQMGKVPAWEDGNTTLVFEAGGDAGLASIHWVDEEETGQQGLAPGGVPLTTTTSTMSDEARTVSFDETFASCLVVNTLQGQTLRVGDRRAWTRGSWFDEDWGSWCDLPLGTILADVRLEAVAVERIADRPALHLKADADLIGYVTLDLLDQGISAVSSFDVWVADNLSFPLRMSWATDDGRTATLDLVGFAPGYAERTPGAPPRELLRLENRTLHPWGLDDAGIDHEHPLSAVFQAAAEAPPSESPLPAFLQEHPEAYVSHADLWEFSGVAHWYWNIEVTGGDEVLAFRVSPRVCGVVCIDGVPTPPEAYAYDDLGIGPRTAPRAGDLPSEAPSVAALFDLWQAYADPKFSEGTPAWGFSWSCVEEDPCKPQLAAQVRRLLEGDNNMPRPIIGTEPGIASDSRMAYSSLQVYGEAVTSLWEYDSTVTSESGLAAAAATSNVPAEESGHDAPDNLLDAFFSAPLQRTAGVGALALALGALYWAWPAVKAGGLGLFSRHTQATVLEHPQRARLVQVVEAQPGIHFKELQRTTGLGNGALAHHTQVLVRHGRLRRIANGGYTCFFPAVPDRALEARAFVLKSDGARRVLAAIQATPGRSNLDVAGLTGLDPGTVHYHVRRLAEAGLVNVRRDGRHTVLDPTASGAAAAGA